MLGLLKEKELNIRKKNADANIINGELYANAIELLQKNVLATISKNETIYPITHLNVLRLIEDI